MTRLPLQIVTPLSRALQPDLESALHHHGYRILHLDGHTITDAASFLARAALDLPMPPGITPRRWSGFVDALNETLYDLPSPGIGILWLSADRMLQGGLADLLLAADCFTEVARRLYDLRERPLKIFLLGDGPNFPQLSLAP